MSESPSISIKEIEDEVFCVLRTLVPKTWPIQKNSALLSELELLSDDATAMILDLERRFRLNIPPEGWSTVATVQDVIDVVARYSNIEK